MSIDNYNAYYRRISHADDNDLELQLFINALTTNETYFFRNKRQFNYLSNIIFPELIRRQQKSGEKKIKIWSAACSTGEEPYSLAMLLYEKIFNIGQWNINILATDINREVLDVARRGEYKSKIVERMPSSYIKKFFMKNKETDTYRIKEYIRKMINFYQHNLIDRNSFGKMDCIFCKNVLIYLDNESKTEVISNLIKSMTEKTYFIIGYAESLMTNYSDYFRYIAPSIYQKKSTFEA